MGHVSAHPREAAKPQEQHLRAHALQRGEGTEAQVRRPRFHSCPCRPPDQQPFVGETAGSARGPGACPAAECCHSSRGGAAQRAKSFAPKYKKYTSHLATLLWLCLEVTKHRKKGKLPSGSHSWRRGKSTGNRPGQPSHTAAAHLRTHFLVSPAAPRNREHPQGLILTTIPSVRARGFLKKSLEWL